jgi:hypothetical protein
MAKDNGGEWLIALAVTSIGYLLITGVLYSKARYYLEYGLPSGVNWDQVTKDKMPHDCNWVAAPLGDKYCHHDARVSSIQVSKDVKTGNPIYSDDEGKTWKWIDSTYPVTPSVYIGWEKVED